MKLNDIRDNAGARKGRVRVGRGIGSGKGKTSARGQKGHKARSGVAIKGFEGGQIAPLRRQQGLHQGTGFRGQSIGIGLEPLDGQKPEIPRELRPGHRPGRFCLSARSFRPAGPKNPFTPFVGSFPAPTLSATTTSFSVLPTTVAVLATAKSLLVSS